MKDWILLVAKNENLARQFAIAQNIRRCDYLYIGSPRALRGKVKGLRCMRVDGWQTRRDAAEIAEGLCRIEAVVSDVSIEATGNTDNPERRDATMTELMLIADIRAAAGDRTGKLMQRELVLRISALREMSVVLRQIADMPRRTKEQRLAKACVTFFDAMENAA